MVALSMADGYARLTRKPQCVIVHVDVGTQGLGAAVHDAAMGRCPVLIFAGLSPYTIEGEHRGSRTEYIHWIQDVPDQRQIISQYCRYTGEIKTGKNVKQMVNRALSFATSDPKGPVYLVGAREVMEQDIEPYSLKQNKWNPVDPAALPFSGVERIAEALVNASEPLVITGYSGRNHGAVEQLVKLANIVKGLRVLDTGGSDMCFPADHPGWRGMRYGSDESITQADLIICLDVDVPWVPTQCKPKPDARIFHIDVDPLKHLMPTFYIPAIARYQADSFTSLRQINNQLTSKPLWKSILEGPTAQKSWDRLVASHKQRLSDIAKAAQPDSDDHFGPSFVAAAARKACPADTIWVIEAVTSAGAVHDNIQATQPGTWINCGGGGLGWSGGAALGIKLASLTRDHQVDIEDPKKRRPTFICQIVGDGTFMFSVPSSVYWISQRYSIPILTIVLNNRGWNAPKKSLLLVHPEGQGSRATNEELNISFAPSPDYAGIAVAAAGGRCWAGRTSKASELGALLEEAVKVVKGGMSAVLDAQMEGGIGAFRKDIGESSG